MQVKIKKWNINYEEIGEGNPIIMLHGWLTDLESMRPLAANLSKKFKIYLVDVVGFGKSDLPEEPLTSDDFGDFLKEFMEKLNIQNPILIGHSNGGRIIINAVGRKIISPKKIVLIDSAGLKPKRKLTYYIKVGFFKTGKIILNLLPNTESAKNLRKKLRGKVGSSDYKSSPTVLKDTMKIILNEDQRPLLKNINVPTLLIWGGLDTATPISDAKEIEKSIPNCGLVEYPYGTHFSYLENIENCKLVLDEFFKNDI
ncbi:MAG: alpha/beta fold hydrolase [Candidatus Scatovivens sp.]